MKKKFLEAGKIVNTHGIHGEVKIQPWMDSPNEFCSLKKAYIDNAPYDIVKSRVNNECVIVSLKGIDDINTAMTLKNKVLLIDREDYILPDGKYFIQDLIGLKVVDENGTDIGKITDVLNMPGNDVYVVNGNTEHLIPAVPEFILSVDFVQEEIKVHLLEGM